MSVPGAGQITAVPPGAQVDDITGLHSSSRAVGHLGLKPRASVKDYI
jgi:hypothetical protein